MINQTDLKYFLEVAKTLHVSRAAERLGITQPALSHCLKRIEEETRLELFTRSKKGVLLTAAGERFFYHAKELVSKWDDLLRAAQEEVHEIRGNIRLGCHSAVAQYALPSLLPDFLQKFPDLSVTLTHGLSRHVTEMIVNSQLDVGVVVNPVANPNLVIKELAQDRVTVWKSKNCQNSDVLIIEPSLLQTQDILRKLEKKGIRFKRTVESSSLEVIAQLVNSGAGYGILPERVVKAFASAESPVHQVRDAFEFIDRICLVYKPEFRKIKRGEVLIKHLSQMKF